MAMDKKKFLASVGLSLILFLSMGNLAVNAVKANPLPPSWMNPQMTISIQSPLPLQTMKPYGLPVLLNFRAQCSWEFALVNTPPISPSQDWIRAFYYVLDGQNMSSAGVNFTEIQTVTHANDSDHYFDYYGQAKLGSLTSGIHNVTVYWGVLVNVGTPAQFIVYNPSWSATSQFYVDSTIPSSLPSTQQLALEVTDVIKLRNYGGFYGAVYDSGTDEVYVANVDFNLVSVISANNRTEVAEVPVGSQPLGVACDSGKREIFVANYESNSVSVISDNNRIVVATVSVGRHPTALVYDSGKGEIFVVNRDDNTVSVISDITNTVVATIPVGETPYGIAYSSNGGIYVTNYDDNTVSVISDSTNRVAATVQVGINPYHAAYDSGKGEIFVTNNNSSSVSVISDITNAVVTNINVGNLPMGLTYDSEQGLVFVGNYGDNSVSVISDASNTVIETILSQQQPFALAYDSAHGQVFVAHMESWSVSVISDSSGSISSPTATDSASPSASSISTQKPTAEPSLTHSPTPNDKPGNNYFTLELAGLVLIAIAATCLLAYFKKKR